MEKEPTVSTPLAFLVWCLLQLSFLKSISSVPLSSQAEALLSWKGNLTFPSTDPRVLNSWSVSSNGSSPCGWYGIQCNTAMDSVTQLSLPGFRFSGTLERLNFSAFPDLTHLVLANNSFSGNIPTQIGELTSLQELDLSSNSFTGHIPSSLTNLSQLSRLSLSTNALVGEVPSNIGALTRLRSLLLTRNLLTGEIPSSITNLSGLAVLSLRFNRLSGEIPSNIGALSRLTFLGLRDNRLTGGLPPSLFTMSKLAALAISSNNLTGVIPPSIGAMSSIDYFNLSNNHFTGELPRSIANFSGLTSLDVSANNLSGKIPAEIGELERLMDLNLSHNKFSGSIPSSFSILSSLSSIDFSYNQLEGPVPNSNIFRNASSSAFMGNRGLCGEVQGLQLCNSSVVNGNGSSPVSGNGSRGLGTRYVIIIVVIAAVLVIAVFVVLVRSLIYRTPVRSRSSSVEDGGTSSKKSEDVFSVWNYDGKFVFEDIVEATDDFDDENCLGIGGSGSVYEAELVTGQRVAVKKLHSAEGDDDADEKNFRNEIQALVELRHRNIVKLYGFCSHPRCKLLVYEFMEKGSLAGLLQNPQSAMELDWVKRVSIIKDVANALSYMHHDFRPPILHRDITSKNILLNEEFKACVSDFGTSKFLKQSSSNWTAVAGTIGYLAPELAYSGRVTAKSDVYSFGVVALEVIHGGHPGELLVSISSSSAAELHGMMLVDVLDKRLDYPSEKVEKEVIAAMAIAMACTRSNPVSRPDMKRVAEALAACRPSIGLPLQGITIGQLKDAMI
ncbi:hypothetical protein H6P81_014917 [Aristolochia fimbriata]|uniref:non-specific serine/threonine protein kinase n=1 Tax=Aristolochia fimbriata TaxID=158543 RepID=A0AAV7E7V6_ARIFI|nr:hypothetical protein H6P81_014917 [Aristolochia fimbriata]